MSNGEQNPTETVELPEGIITKIETRLPRTEWETPQDYICYVLEEVLVQVEEKSEESNINAINEDEVKNRLESLGYLNN